VTTLDGPGVVDGTILTGINDGGKIVGFYQVSGEDADGNYFANTYNFVLSR
jgi:hypothetical protein